MCPYKYVYNICIILQYVRPNALSCSISNQTVQIVDSCPQNEKEWKEASAKKNCSGYAHRCNDPDNLLYHCVINPFINETLEVCANVVMIIQGKETCFSHDLIRREYFCKSFYVTVHHLIMTTLCPLSVFSSVYWDEVRFSAQFRSI